MRWVEVMMRKSVVGDVNEKREKEKDRQSAMLLSPRPHCSPFLLLPRLQKGVQGYMSKLILTYALSLSQLSHVSASPPHSFDPNLYTRKDTQDSFE